MAILTIFAADGVKEEKRCVIRLTDDEGQDLLKSEDFMTPAIARANAQCLKNQGPTGKWETIDKNIFRFKPISDTVFQVFTEIEKIKNTLKQIKDKSILWNPPELNPAAGAAKRDTTPGQGKDGS